MRSTRARGRREVTSLLEVEDLRLRLGGRRGTAMLVDGVSFALDRDETLGIVGESGCGKSLLALAVMGLLPDIITATGRIRFEGRDLLTLPERERCAVRGHRIAMVFQDAMGGLDPRLPILHQVAEGMRLHLRLGRAEAETRGRALLDRVGLHGARVPPDALPGRLSGGQRQRVLIAIALACRPSLLIADEFSTALDMATQADIMQLLREVARENAMALMLISHDLGLVRDAAARVMVLYAGRVAELGDARAVLERPMHPNTRGLLATTLHGARHAPGSVLPTIPGQVPDPFEGRGTGCAFVPRCTRAAADCAAVPHLAGRGTHRAACFHPVADA